MGGVIQGGQTLEVEFAFLCDYADNSAKLHALGIGFDALYAANVPATHPVMHAVVRLRFTSVETGEKQFGIRVIDADGKLVVTPVDGTIRVSPPASGRTSVANTVALALHGLKLEQYGDYAVSWLVDGAEVKRLTFTVMPPPPAAAKGVQL